MCLTETWRLDENPWLPPFLSEYKPFWVQARKEVLGSRGRGSGGLLILVKSAMDCEVFDSTDQWCCVKIHSSNLTLFICTVYFNPKVDVPLTLDALQAVITNICDLYSDPMIIVGGDLNCRIKNFGGCDPHLVEGSILYPDRSSLDVCNPSAHGVAFMDFMMDNSFVLLNGRAPRDRPAQYTFVDHQGKSVIDLIFVTINCISFISDFIVDTSVTSSSHFPVNLTLADPASEETENHCSTRSVRLKWNRLDKEVFTKYLEEVMTDYSFESSVDEMYDSLCEAFLDAAGSAGMILTSGKTNGRSSRVNRKPWFDDVCYAKKKEQDRALKNAEKAGFVEPQLSIFVECRYSYNQVKTERKKLYEQNIKDKLANTRNAAEFWTAVRCNRVTQYTPGLPVEMRSGMSSTGISILREFTVT